MKGSYALCQQGRDDFGLIADAKLLGYKDLWLDKLILGYENKTNPCGRL